MNNTASSKLHYVIQAVLLCGLALFIGSLVKSNTLHIYLAPRTEKWMFLCPLLLGLMAIFTAYKAIAPDDDTVCGCSHEVPKSLLRRIVIYVLFILPLGFGTLLPNRTLGSSAAYTKGFSLTVPLLNEHESQDKSKISSSLSASTSISKLNVKEGGQVKVFEAPDKYNQEFAQLAGLLYAEPVIEVTPDIYSETIGAIELFKHDFIGKSISLTGFVYKGGSIGQTGDEFAVGRFLVLCCTADALPFGVLVKIPSGTASIPRDTWVKVTGSLNVEQSGTQETLRIDATDITQVKQPDVPYVYPNADSVVAFKQAHPGQ